MNLVYKYLRKRVKKGQSNIFAYFSAIALRNKKMIMDHCKMVDVEEVYSRCCVNTLPLTLTCKKNLPNCNVNRKRKVPMYDDTPCLQCWLNVLENLDKSIDQYALVTLPSFLKDKSKQQIVRPTSLLKKKEPPSFLKK